jgi:hypothetical protein
MHGIKMVGAVLVVGQMGLIVRASATCGHQFRVTRKKKIIINK